ncbi:MAG: hypothetical protein IJH91_06530 [Mogibacterium sp.]|nr:hypothetical protein [Mogibacterium sp.]
MKRIIILISLSAVPAAACVLSACSGASGGSGGEEDGQNPVMNFIGEYACDRAVVLVEAGEGNSATVTVTWGSSAWESSEWVMSGEFDENTLTIEYRNCVRTDHVYKSDGTVELENVMYEDGGGFIVFSEGDGLSLVWEDDQEHVADGMVFTYVYEEADE